MFGLCVDLVLIEHREIREISQEACEDAGGIVFVRVRFNELRFHVAFSSIRLREALITSTSERTGARR